MKIKRILSIILCLILAMSFVVAVPASAQVYSILEFTGLELPVPGNCPDYTINSLNDDYDVMNFAGQDMIIWTDEDESNEMRYNEEFVAGHDYRVRIYLEPTNAETELIPDAKFFMDNSGLGWYLYEDSNGLYAQKYFDTCGEIKNACLYIDKPSIGAKPDFTLTHDNRFVAEGNISPVKNGVSWYDVTNDKYLISGTDAVFKADCAYMVTFNLRSYESEFVAGGQITVNEFDSMVEILGNGFATVKFLFAPMEHKCAPTFVKPEPPKCEEYGHIGYYECECGKIYWDKEANEPANEDEITLEPTGHANVIVKGKGATYFATGLTDGEKCQICGKWSKEQETIAKKKLAQVLSLKVKSSKKSTATVTWKKVKDASGYIVEYSTSKKFTKKTTKKATVKKGATIKTTLKKLKSGKKYYVRVKAYKTYKGKTVYGKLSKVVNAKIK